MPDTLFPLESIPPQKHPFRCDCAQCQGEIRKRMIPCPNCGATGIYDDCTCSYCDGAKEVYDVNYTEEAKPLPVKANSPKKTAKPAKSAPPPLADHYKILASSFQQIAKSNSYMGLARQLTYFALKDQVVRIDELVEIASHLKGRWGSLPTGADVIRRAVELRYLEEVR